MRGSQLGPFFKQLDNKSKLINANEVSLAEAKHASSECPLDQEYKDLVILRFKEFLIKIFEIFYLPLVHRRLRMELDQLI